MDSNEIAAPGHPHVSAENITLFQASSVCIDSIKRMDQIIFAKSGWWNLDLWKGVLKSPSTRVLVIADVGSEIFGFVAFDCKGKIMKLGVLPEWQGKGVGSRLLDSALETIDVEFRKQCLNSTLHVESTNYRAIRLYESRGFVVDYVVRDYYAPSRDALRMLRDKVTESK